ncbi:MAG: recombination mediator RecR [Gammaproteobacteria bacterium]|nr:recombination mediator RecR [Gammaproteobacteria bacterium]
MNKHVIFSPLIDHLIDCLRVLPGVGPKSAQRIVFHLLERNRDGGFKLSLALRETLQHIKHCSECRNFSENDICHLCSNPARDNTLLCIVETPADVFAIEQTAGFRGYYFVLQGHLSPLDGIGPKELGIETLMERVKNNPIKEVILATNSTIEGEVTAHHIAKLLKPLNISATRIAHGVPMGGELEYVDGTTLMRALSGRKPLEA